MIEQVLVISDTHIPVIERRSAVQAGLGDPLSLDAWDRATEAEPALATRHPNLKKAVETARKRRCSWLKLSPDAEAIGDLPEFE